MRFSVGLLVLVAVSLPSYGTKSTGRRAECEAAVAQLRGLVTELTKNAQSGDTAARASLEEALAPAFDRYARYYHRLMPSLSEETLKSVARTVLHARLAGAPINSPRTREFLSDCIGRAMRHRYHQEIGESQHEQTERRRMDGFQQQLTERAGGRPPTLPIIAATARVTPDHLRHHLSDASLKSNPPPVSLAPVISNKQAQLAAIDRAKSHPQTRQTLGLLILQLRKMKLNDANVAKILEREGMGLPPGESAWNAQLVRTLYREIWKAIVSTYPEISLTSRGTQNQLILELAAQGFSFREIAVLFNEKSIPSPKEVGWSHTVLGRRYREAVSGILVRTNVPEQMGWHGKLTDGEIDALVARVNAEDDSLTPEELILTLRHHGLPLQVIADRLNEAGAGSGDQWQTGMVNEVIRDEQRAVIQEFLSVEAPDLVPLRQWCERFDAVSIAPRETSLLIGYVYPQYASEFSDRSIAQYLAVRALGAEATP